MIFKKCPNCEFENPETAKFCNECGSKLTPEEGAASLKQPPPLEAMPSDQAKTAPLEPVQPEPKVTTAAPPEEPAEARPIPPAVAILPGPVVTPPELLASPPETPLLPAVETLIPEKDQITTPEAAPAPPRAEVTPEPVSPPESAGVPPEVPTSAPIGPAIELLEGSDLLAMEMKRPAQEPPVEEPETAPPFGERFRIVEELGTGTLGTVYKVIDQAMERELVIKSVKPEISEKAESFEGFSRELKVERGLVHKNIARIFELILLPGKPFITMEYVPGRDLKSILKEKKRLPVGEAFPIVKQLFSGLAEAHEAGALHLDLRPENIMIDREGTVKIMDLGIARLLRAKGIIRAVSGMPQYMSPEQLEGRGADARSDIFAAGAIIYEMLTGNLPPVGETPRNPRELNPEIPRELSLLVLRCLEQEKERRYATAREIRADLERIEDEAGQAAARPILSPEPMKSSEPIKAGETPAKAAATLEEAVQPARPGKKKRRRSVVSLPSRAMVPALVLLAAVILAVFLWKVVFKSSKTEPTLPSAPSKISLAILPFEDMSPAKERQPLGTAMAETMIRSLAKVDNVFIPAIDSSAVVLGKARDSRQVGLRLHVDHYLEGTFQADAGKIKIDARLIRADSGASVWTGQFDRTTSDLAAVLEEMVGAVMKTIGAGGPAQRSSPPVLKYPTSFEAYNLNAQGRFFLSKGGRDNLEKSIELFTSSASRDPAYASAFEGMADAYIRLADAYLWPSGKAFPKAKDAALKALLLDPGLADAHTALGRIRMSYEWDFAGAEKECQEALKVDPASSAAHQSYAWLLAALGQHAPAQQEILSAQALSPLDSEINAQVGLILFYGRLYEQADDEFKKALVIDPVYPGNYFEASLVEIQMGRLDEAMKSLQEAEDLGQNRLEVDVRRGCIYARLGQRLEAGRVLTEALKADKKGFVSDLSLALIYAGLSEKEQAIACLENAVIDRDPALIFMRVHPFLDSVRGDMRFVSLLQKVGLGPY
jgi:serine/threonine protein kinase/Tfp pilus assembly protein PilF